MSFEQSHPVYALSSELVDELCGLFPDDATYLGVTGFDDKWPDLSPAGAERTVAALERMDRHIVEMPEPTNKWEDLAIAVAHDEIQRLRAGYDNQNHLRNLNSISSPVQNIREAFDHMKKDTVEAWANVATRMELLPELFAGFTAALDEGRGRSLAVPVRQVTEAARQAAVQASDASAFEALQTELAESGIQDDALRERIDRGIATARAAYGDLASYLRTIYAPDAPERDAAGEERYRREVRQMLGTDIDPHEAYAWGWEEVEAIRARMNDVAEQIAPGEGIAGALHLLKTDPTRSAATSDELVTFLAARLDEALDRLAGTHFDVPDPIRRCDVKLAPPGGSLGAYYVGPSEDFTRAGSVWWSILRDEPRPLYEDVTTAYHEGFPGHHLQVGIQVSLSERLSRLHRLWVWMPGSGEGWALYAERLMDELGYLDEPDYVFGYLASQIHRACRVVIDIGSHLELPIPGGQPFHPGESWSFETAVEMLEEYATLDRPYAESEINRYLGWPAQAIAYKLGEREILRLRETARANNGFDLKEFHARLLEVGPVGLDLLRQFTLAE